MSGFDLGGQVCVVTGGLGLIGRAFAAALHQAGASVVLTDLDHGACVDRAHALGPTALGHGADITQPASLAGLRDAIVKRFGRIDALVNSAAIDDKFEARAAAHASLPEHYAVEQFRRIMDANVIGTFLTCQVLGAPMLAAGKGSIVNVSSTYGLVGPDQSLYTRPDGTQPFHKSPAYPTSKAAVLGFTRYLATTWGARGVRVNALCPGGVENGQAEHFVAKYAARTPLGRMASASDYGGAIVFLCSDASAYMTGASLVVDGGWTAW
ncbi:MAG: SDR family oxidoreductase [Deltaproteobacteria bacterium]|nr:SDR family oxidoreductase [Deltaproteobacteria bacterium]